MNTPQNSYTSAAEQIKEAILSSQYTAAKQVNAVQLSLYYGVGRYVSQNTRKGVWGTGAIKAISEQLHKELPGLRGAISKICVPFMRRGRSWILIRQLQLPNCKLLRTRRLVIWKLQFLNCRMY